MIKKLLHKSFTLVFLLTLPIITHSVLAQNQTRLDNAFSTEKTESEDYRTQDVILSWDFEQINNRELSSSLSIEVQPLNGCWNELNGSNRSEKLTFQIENFPQNQQGNLTFSHHQLKSKCFKWRAKITNNTETSFTDWQFSSFL